MIEFTQMYKISIEIIRFIENTLENCRVKQRAVGKTLSVAKIEKGVIKGYMLSPLQFVLAMMPLNRILRKFTGRYNIHISKEKKTPHFHGRYQIVCRKLKRIRNSNTGSEDIQSWYKDGILHRKMCHANNEQRKTTNDGRNRTTESGKNQNAQRKGNLQILGNIGSGHHQRVEDLWKWKNKKEYLKRTIKLLGTKLHSKNLTKGDSLSRNILGTFFKVYEGRTTTKGPENKKTHDNTLGLTLQRLRWRIVCVEKRRSKKTRQHWP